MNKYLKLIQAKTPYADRMTRLRNRIFGDPVRKTDKPSMKVVKMLSQEPVYMSEWVVNYYPRHRELSALTRVLRHYGLFRDEHEDFKALMQKARLSSQTKIRERPTRPPKSGPKQEIHPFEKIPLKINVELK